MTPAERAFVGMVRAAGRLMREVEVLLGGHGLTSAQYNVLRILRGAGAKGACGRDIAARLIAAEPDITRLLDRMEKRGLISRRRETGDRRYVTARIAEAGLQILAALDAPVSELHRRQFAGISGSEVKEIVAITEKLAAEPPRTRG